MDRKMIYAAFLILWVITVLVTVLVFGRMNILAERLEEIDGTCEMNSEKIAKIESMTDMYSDNFVWITDALVEDDARLDELEVRIDQVGMACEYLTSYRLEGGV